ncbi:MAG: glutamate racemase [Pseudomonadota bacterium]
MSTAPIGVFDSGVGGLSILRSISELLPNERLIYVADSANAPYGPKGEDFIQHRSAYVMEYFTRQQVKAVVIACNTATAAAIAMLRARYALPIIGVEPAVKPAAEQSRSGVVGVLATSGTIASDKFFHLQNRFSDRVEILTRAGTGLVELIEQPQFDEAAVLRLLENFIKPMQVKGADTLVLGCTHYSLIREQITRVAGPGMKIFDAGGAVAKELQRRLQLQGLDNLQTQRSSVSFVTSGYPAFHQQALRRYWGSDAELTALA